MNTNSELDRIVKGFLEDRVSAPPRPAVLRDAIKHTAATPQTRRRFLGRWLDHPLHTDRRTTLMLSATGVTAAIAIIALSVNVFDTSPPVPGAAGTTHVVASDGSGDFATIQEAVDAAADGDVVSVKPGRYEGTITIARDITLRGDGPPDQIVIAAPPGEVDAVTWPVEETRPHAVLLDGADATVTDLSVEVPLGSTGIGSMGGDPLIERVSIVIAGEPVPEDEWYDAYYAMGFYGAGNPIVRDSAWNGYTAVREGAAVLFEGNTVSIDGLSIDGPGASVVRRNTFLDGGSVNASGATVTVEGNDFTSGDFSADSGSIAEVRDNVFRGFGAGDVSDAAIRISDPDSQATIENNTVSGTDNGIAFHGGATGSIRGNTLEADRIAIQLGPADGARVEDNVITGEGAGIVIGMGSDAVVTGNDVDVAGRGISILAGSSPTVSGNVVCGMEGIWIHDTATPELGENEVC